MPQDKFITRQQAGLKEVKPKYQFGRETFTKDALDASAEAHRKKFMSEGPAKAADLGRDARKMVSSKAVTARDAANAATSRGRLAARASSAKVQPRGGRMTSNMAAMGPIAGAVAAADALYAADEATGFRRTKYSGPSGGPSFSMNPYASSNKSAYNGQSAMSKMMGVGKKK